MAIHCLSLCVKEVKEKNVKIKLLMSFMDLCKPAHERRFSSSISACVASALEQFISHFMTFCGHPHALLCAPSLSA